MSLRRSLKDFHHGRPGTVKCVVQMADQHTNVIVQVWTWNLIVLYHNYGSLTMCSTCSIIQYQSPSIKGMLLIIADRSKLFINGDQYGLNVFSGAGYYLLEICLQHQFSAGFCLTSWKKKNPTKIKWGGECKTMLSDNFVWNYFFLKSAWIFACGL